MRIDATDAVKLFMAAYDAVFIASTNFSELDELLSMYSIRYEH